MKQYVSEKRHAKQGERIVVVAPDISAKSYEQGDILTASSVDSHGDVFAEINGRSVIVYPREYEVLPEVVTDFGGANSDEYAQSLDELCAQVTDENRHLASEKRIAKVGERIVVVDPRKYREYEQGDIYSVASAGVGSVITDCGKFIHTDEYEVIQESLKANTSDNVNSPAHYTQGGTEVIDIIAQIAGGYSDGFEAYAVGNAIKYLARAPHKHATIDEDIAKAIRYLQFVQERRADCK